MYIARTFFLVLHVYEGGGFLKSFLTSDVADSVLIEGSSQKLCEVENLHKLFVSRSACIFACGLQIKAKTWPCIFFHWFSLCAISPSVCTLG